MVIIFNKNKQEVEEKELPMNTFSNDLVLLGSSVELLRDIRERVEYLQARMNEIERKIDDRIPEKILSEQKFLSEVESSGDIVEKIVEEVKAIPRTIIHPGREQLTVVETKKMEKIATLLQEHGKLSSIQLAQLLNLSRTRANEYLKQMEGLGLAKSFLAGKEKFYEMK